MYQEKTERFHANILDEITLNDTKNDPHKVKSIILAKVKDPGFCYGCRKKLIATLSTKFKMIIT